MNDGIKFCGCNERIGSSGSKWGLNELTWCISTPVISRSIQVEQQQKVFDHISTIVNLKFKQVDNPAQANLIYLAGRGQRAGLDGQGGTLGYAYLPNNANYRGQLNCVFDLDERWETAIKFFNVSYHETLHLLGLDHSSRKDQLMSSFYNDAIAYPQVEDENRLISLYGKAPVETPVAPAPPTKSDEIILKMDGVTHYGTVKWTKSVSITES